MLITAYAGALTLFGQVAISRGSAGLGSPKLTFEVFIDTRRVCQLGERERRAYSLCVHAPSASFEI